MVAAATHCFWCKHAISDELPKGHPRKATADHYIPKSKGGTDDIANLVPCCFSCNNRRQDRDPEEWMRVLAGDPTVPGYEDW